MVICFHFIYMRNIPLEKELSIIPHLYSTEKIPLSEKWVYLHFFLHDCHWFIVEYDRIDRLFFCFTILNGDKLNAEWGYTSFDELISMKSDQFKIEIEKDVFFIPRQVKYIPEISKCDFNNFC
ncbi:MAG: hypothetical protein ACD_79C01515G0004 [uncultured bacterium]|nr:MAG: hypothetical protein ACD_79C01515G0004 [uncultured bacterium]